MSEKTTMTIRTRFAPSPSGHLHVGGARTALFCWAFARGRDGRFIVRIEDTDQKRSSDAASLGFLADLKWLGIDWDEGPEFEGCGGGDAGPYFQAQRLDIYDRHMERLLAEGGAYRAFETPEELDAARAAARAAKQPYRYDRAGLRLPPETIASYLAEGRPHVVRFRVPDEESVTVHDHVLGDITVSTDELDDFVIRKADGYPTYHFAVVVDDELMDITHVIRAQEHVNNTPRHILLQRALGFRVPEYAHISVISNPDGSKMSKRDKDRVLRATVTERGIDAPPELDGAPVVDADTWTWWRSSKDHQLDLEAAVRLAAALRVELPEINVDDFRRAGYLPGTLVNYLALLGWSPGGDVEKFDRAFFTQRFDLDRVVKSAAKFDRDKLLAFSLDTIQALTPAEFCTHLRAHCERYHPEFLARLTDAQFELLASSNHERSKTLEDPIRTCRFLVQADDEIEYETSKPVRKAMTGSAPNGFDHLAAVLPVLDAIDAWTVETIEAQIAAYARDHADDKLGKVAQPLRIAVSGGTVSPPIFDTLAMLGKASVLARVRRCLAQRESLFGAAV
ncbi:MAG: glutamate--tRNA ligase [Phycisphaerales bacterium]|nr:glutamate--tRNA ligase [Phycisphaerales bacterium]